MDNKKMDKDQLEKVSGGGWKTVEVTYYNWFCNNKDCSYSRSSWKTESSVSQSCPKCGSTDIKCVGTTRTYKDIFVEE